MFSASNGKEALAILEKQKIDFVISDVQMPIMDGVELLKSIRAVDPKMPIVLLATGQADVTEESALSLGAIGLLHKPFSTGTVLDVVQRSLSAEFPKNLP